MLYWGAQGITRDIGAALDYYRRAAESGDPQALFDYGIVLLKVHTPIITYLISILAVATVADFVFFHAEANQSKGLLISKKDAPICI